MTAWLWVTPAFAQSDNGALRLETSPLPVNLVTTPGHPVSVTLRIRNDGSATETLKLGLLTFTANDENGSPKLLERQPGDLFFDWVHFEPAQLTVTPNAWQEVTMTISPPPSAALGYYYAVTFSRANPTVAPAGQQNAVIGATAILVLLDVEVPGAKRQAVISQFATDHPWYEFLPVNLTTKTRNTGNIQLAPSGTIFITNAANQVVGQLAVNQAKGSILPQSTRAFTSVWQDGFPVYQPKISNQAVVHNSQGHVVQQLTWDLRQANKLRFGKYTAHLVLAYTDHGRDVPLEASTSFWVIPWRLFLVAGLAALFVGIGIVSTIWTIWRKIVRKD